MLPPLWLVVVPQVSFSKSNKHPGNMGRVPSAPGDPKVTTRVLSVRITGSAPAKHLPTLGEEPALEGKGLSSPGGEHTWYDVCTAPTRLPHVRSSQQVRAQRPRPAQTPGPPARPHLTAR